jgi:hypothetical protein
MSEDNEYQWVLTNLAVPIFVTVVSTLILKELMKPKRR